MTLKNMDNPTKNRFSRYSTDTLAHFRSARELHLPALQADKRGLSNINKHCEPEVSNKAAS